jgi:hypothetical protein
MFLPAVWPTSEKKLYEIDGELPYEFVSPKAPVTDEQYDSADLFYTFFSFEKLLRCIGSRGWSEQEVTILQFSEWSKGMGLCHT